MVLPRMETPSAWLSRIASLLVWAMPLPAPGAAPPMKLPGPPALNSIPSLLALPPVVLVGQRRCAVGGDADEVALDEVAVAGVEHGDAVAVVAGDNVAVRRCGAADGVRVLVVNADPVRCIGLGHRAVRIGADEVAGNQAIRFLKDNPLGSKAVDAQAADDHVRGGDEQTAPRRPCAVQLDCDLGIVAGGQCVDAGAG